MQFICFSSGAQRRYRDDIIRAMAMPSGCELNFRYRLKYLSNSVLENLRNNRIGTGHEVLICYLDQSDRGKQVFFIPVRFARILAAPLTGDFVVIRMRVEEFAYAADTDAFNKDVHSRSAEVPKWPSDTAAKYAIGAFWVEVDEYPKSVVRSVSIENWQKTVSQLLERKDFASTGPFYRVVQLQQLRTLGGHFKTGHMWPSQNRPYELYPDRVVLLRLPTSGKLT